MRVYIKSVLPKKSTSLWAEIISKTYNNDIFERLTNLPADPGSAGKDAINVIRELRVSRTLSK
ncbi:MAG TPA: hypothetical protein VE264_02575 [Nitrososphaera sp.]|jgi:hypothetical protein|nr:hypothetical protein [Nitrososphaera sp.]